MKYCLLFILLGCFFTPQSYATCFQGDCENGQGTYRSADAVISVGEGRTGSIMAWVKFYIQTAHAMKGVGRPTNIMVTGQ